ncbi:MAG: DedA family protein [Planctomycetota bacterium]|nr:DedA family protein [Planctomycetota bacterium]
MVSPHILVLPQRKRSARPTSLAMVAARIFAFGMIVSVMNVAVCTADDASRGKSGAIESQADSVPQNDSAFGRAVQKLLTKFGPMSVFFLMIASGVGLHFPEDMVIIPAGWEIATGDFPLAGTFLAAYAGVVLGDTGWFLLCRFFGKRLLRTRWLLRAVHPRRILEIKYLIDRYGAWVLVVCRFVPGARTPALTVGGLMRLSGWIFLAVELPMVAMTVTIQLALGYYAARGLLAEGSWQKVALGVGILVAIGVIALILVVRRRLASGEIRLPRVSVLWLKRLRKAA